MTTPSRRLRDLLGRPAPIIAPGAYDALSARCIERAGFEAIATTGFGMHGVMLGAPDNGLLAFNEMVDACGKMADAVSLPVIADGEGGYGNAINVTRTVRAFEKAGMAGLFIEDQQLPPNCPFLQNTRMISANEMCGKIEAACAARRDLDFLIVARTDARGDEAIRRCNLYADAGADMAKVIPHSLEELELYPRRIKIPMHLGFTPGKGINDGMTAQDAGMLGYRIVTFPLSPLLVSAKALMDFLSLLKRDGTDEGLLSRTMPLEAYFDLVAAKDFKQLEERFLRS